jgi:stage III sporulation protein AE
MKKILLAAFFCMAWLPSVCLAKEKETETEWLDSISLDEVQKAFDETQEESGVTADDTFSIQEYVSGIISGTDSFSFRELWQKGISRIEENFDSQKQTLLRILVLGVLSGIFLNFAGTIGDKTLSETGFYVTFLLLIATMTAGFAEVTEVAMNAMDNLLTFMKALIPSFSLTLCLGLGTGTSVAYYESMLVVIAFLEMMMTYVFIPGVQVYFMLSIINQLADNHFSKLAELVRSFLRFANRILLAVLIGYQGIQGMLLPLVDKVKNSTLIQAAKGLPGIGNSIGTVTDTVLGSGMLIKSAVGTGGILCIIILCFYPLLKLFIFQLMYRVGGALVQPVSDKRVAAVLSAAAESGVLLMKFVFAGALMFLLSITIVVVSTNLTM